MLRTQQKGPEEANDNAINEPNLINSQGENLDEEPQLLGFKA
jgi:hypothetical protein